MNPSSIAIIVIIAISAAVFGGIVLLGSPGRTPAMPPVVSDTLTRIPGILNLPGFGSRVPQAPNQTFGGGQTPLGTGGLDVVVEKNELPAPAIPPAPEPSQLPRPGIRVPTPSRMSTPAFMPTPAPQAQPVQQIPAPSSVPAARSQTAVAAVSVFTAIPQLGVLRTQMVQEGVIGSNEFVRIKNNTDMEQFMLKLVEWQAKKASSTPEQIQDALDRIKKAYDQVRR
ncbi:MAG: hypothetical protein HY617_00205 [Candidatus Sungbacteria bacterium]|nr:hypothetical protein [Candidatus Sungbacteria bacterium]